MALYFLIYIYSTTGYKGDEMILTDEQKRGVDTRFTIWPKVSGRIDIPYQIDGSSKYWAFPEKKLYPPVEDIDFFEVDSPGFSIKFTVTPLEFFIFLH